jgi:hypothetical protein
VLAVRVLIPALVLAAVGIAGWRLWDIHSRRSEDSTVRYVTDLWLQVFAALVGVIVIAILIGVAQDVWRNI